ncbi:unnamed protein product [Chrysoparadoxa australica]
MHIPRAVTGLLLGSGRRNMSTGGGPRELFMLQYSYVEGILEKRTPYREEHLSLLSDSNSGCALGGAFTSPPDGAALIFDTKEAAERFVEVDPYKKNGLVTEYKIRPYMAGKGIYSSY